MKTLPKCLIWHVEIVLKKDEKLKILFGK